MLSKMMLETVKNYILERYDEKTAAYSMEYINQVKERGVKAFETSYGFVTYKPEGDAVVLYDMYVKPSYRATKQAWKLFDKVVDCAKQLHKQVIITFSEKQGKNQELGIAAINAAGFIKAFETNANTVYIRSV